jgi:hypothetical protein
MHLELVGGKGGPGEERDREEKGRKMPRRGGENRTEEAREGRGEWRLGRCRKGEVMHGSCKEEKKRSMDY